jgi:hypothetical protein
VAKKCRVSDYSEQGMYQICLLIETSLQVSNIFPLTQLVCSLDKFQDKVILIFLYEEKKVLYGVGVPLQKVSV